MRTLQGPPYKCVTGNLVENSSAARIDIFSDLEHSLNYEKNTRIKLYYMSII